MLFFRYNSTPKTNKNAPHPPKKEKTKRGKNTPPKPRTILILLKSAKKVHLLKCKLQLHLHVSIGRSPQQQNHCRLFQQRHHAQQNECGDEQRADGVGNVPPKVLNKQGGDNDANAAQSVGHHVQEDSWNKPVCYACRVCGPVGTQIQISIHFKNKTKKLLFFLEKLRVFLSF